MRFRPCIDIHKGKVKQIVGATLKNEEVTENFVSDMTPADYAAMYRRDGLSGGHVILLSRGPEDIAAGLSALMTYPGGLEIGGGINLSNAEKYIETGAAGVIVTSFIFTKGGLSAENLRKISDLVTPEKLVIDISCGKGPDGRYYVCRNGWRQMTGFEVCEKSLNELSAFCGEFLVHAVSEEGRMKGPDTDLAELLSSSPVSVTYAGGIASFEDISKVEEAGKGLVDFTVGSALDIFGGPLSYKELADRYK